MGIAACNIGKIIHPIFGTLFLGYAYLCISGLHLEAVCFGGLSQNWLGMLLISLIRDIYVLIYSAMGYFSRHFVKGFDYLRTSPYGIQHRSSGVNLTVSRYGTLLLGMHLMHLGTICISRPYLWHLHPLSI